MWYEYPHNSLMNVQMVARISKLAGEGLCAVAVAEPQGHTAKEKQSQLAGKSCSIAGNRVCVCVHTHSPALGTQLKWLENTHLGICSAISSRLSDGLIGVRSKRREGASVRWPVESLTHLKTLAPRRWRCCWRCCSTRFLRLFSSARWRLCKRKKNIDILLGQSRDVDGDGGRGGSGVAGFADRVADESHCRVKRSRRSNFCFFFFVFHKFQIQFSTRFTWCTLLLLLAFD